ncbi:hypothetical protein HRbin27_00241 [bacterium HR27]|nr:hypothetical protein HRbin27_00241 [bacterium HR27]
MNVGFGIARNVEVDDVAHLWNIEPTGRDIGRDEQVDLSAPEALHCPVAHRLAEIAMDRFCRIAERLQFVRQFVCTALGSNEDDGRCRRFEIEDAGECVEFRRPGNFINELFDLRHGDVLGVDSDDDRFPEIAAG